MLVETKRKPAAQAAEMVDVAHDMELVLSLDLIRAHTKTDDVPAVSDAQLVLYRKAAIEAAQKYTGLLLTKRQAITEAVNLQGIAANRYRQLNHFYHTARMPFALPLAYFYGHRNEPPVQVPVIVGERKVKLPLLIDDFGVNSCCNPCATPVQARLLYSAGFSCESEIPAAIALGALKYVAHLIENPGDIAYANTAAGNLADVASMDKVANPAWASGAIEIWRSVVDHAV